MVMPKQKFEVELDVPDGYEVVDYRPPEPGEVFVLDPICKPVVAVSGTYYRSLFILRKIPVYRDPVLPADWGKQARFSDDGKEWVEDRLSAYAAWKVEDPRRWGSQDRCEYFKFCQIAD